MRPPDSILVRTGEVMGILVLAELSPSMYLKRVCAAGSSSKHVLEQVCLSVWPQVSIMKAHHKPHMHYDIIQPSIVR